MANYNRCFGVPGIVSGIRKSNKQGKATEVRGGNKHYTCMLLEVHSMTIHAGSSYHALVLLEYLLQLLKW